MVTGTEPWLTRIGWLSIAIAMVVPLLVWYVWEQRHERGVRWFLGTLVGAFGWLFFYGVVRIGVPEQLAIFLTGTRLFFIGLASICWTLICIEYVTGKPMSGRVFGFLILPKVLEQLLLFWPPTHELVHGPGSSVTPAGLYGVEPGPVYMAVAVYLLILLMASMGMLISATIRSDGARRTQAVLLLVATLLIVVSGPMAIAGVTPVHPFLVIFPLASSILAYGLVEYRLFEVTPVGRETTVREMNEAVIILDTESVITDVNPAARALFGFDESPIGVPAVEAFADWPTLESAIRAGAPFEEEISIDVDGTERYFVVEITAMEEQRWERGSVVVLRDVTTLKRREQELDLLKQVYARILRHNIRNRLAVIEGYTEVLHDETAEEYSPYTRKVLDTSRQILDHSEKAQVIQSVVDDGDPKTINLDRLLSEIVMRIRKRAPDTTITCDVPPDLAVVAHPELEAAVEELLDNAITHAPEGHQPTITVEAERTGDQVTVVIEDDAGGISEHEIEILDTEAEDQMYHGSGVGLWLVRFVLDWSNGEFDLERTTAGTRATLTLEAPDTTDRVGDQHVSS